MCELNLLPELQLFTIQSPTVAIQKEKPHADTLFPNSSADLQRSVGGVLSGLLLILFVPGVLFSQNTGAFNQRGHILIADQFNNRIIEVDKAHNLIWHFGDGSNIAGPHSVVAPNDAQRAGVLTLVAGTGAPPGTDGCPNGCPDNRVMLVSPAGDIIWQYGQTGITGAGPNQLNTPVQATFLPNFDVLITDQGNQRVIEVNPWYQIVWQYGQTGVSGNGFDQLNNPNSAELLDNGDIL